MRLDSIFLVVLYVASAPVSAASAGDIGGSFLGRAARSARTALTRNTAPVPPVVDTDEEQEEQEDQEEQEEQGTLLVAEKGKHGQPSLHLRPRIVSLNVMVAGLSGLGKTTACAHLLESWKEQSDNENFSAMTAASAALFKKSASLPKGKPILTKTTTTKHVDPSRQFERYDAKENTILRVRIIDTPGFGNRVDHRDSVRPIARYIANCRNRQYKKEISTNYHPNREDVESCDDLVHVCLYFLTPGRFLEMDAHFLKRVQEEVCIVPVIAKADTLTEEEVAAYRAEVVQAFAREGIIPYNFDTKQQRGKRPVPYHRGRRAGEPLAIVSRDGVYPWGEVRSIDPAHSDLMLVRDLLLSGHTETFVELARAKYGVYRANRIRKRRTGDVLRYTALGLLVARACGIPMPGKVAVAVDGIKESMTKVLARLLRLVSNFVSKYQTNDALQEDKEAPTVHEADEQPPRRPILFPWKKSPDVEPTVVEEQTPRLTTLSPRQKRQDMDRKEEKDERTVSADEATTTAAPRWFLWLGGNES